MEITSVTNEIVKLTAKLQQKKFRDKENLFLLEGYKAIEEAFQCGIDIERVFVLKEKSDKYAFLNKELILTNESVLKKISAAETAPEAVAAAKQLHYPLSRLKSAKRLVLLENIHDMGNLGTIFRTSAAFGAEGIILYGNCADPYNPKCVRSSTGNLWKIPFVKVNNYNDLKIFEDFQRVATLPRADKTLKNFKPENKCIILFGSEADGLSDEMIKFSTNSVRIETSQNVESLNLSISCGVVLYHLFTCN